MRRLVELSIGSVFGGDGDSPRPFVAQQSIELTPIPPPQVNEYDDANSVSVTVNVQLGTDNDFVNFQMGESGDSLSRV